MNLKNKRIAWLNLVLLDTKNHFWYRNNCDEKVKTLRKQAYSNI